MVVAKLKVSLLDSLDWIAELVLVEIDNLSQGDQVGSESEEFRETQHTGGEQSFKGMLTWNVLAQLEAGGSCSPVPFLGWKAHKYITIGIQVRSQNIDELLVGATVKRLQYEEVCHFTDL